MSLPSNLQGRVLATGFAALVVSAAAMSPATGAPTAPPDGTYEVTLDSVVLETGEPVRYEATCWTTAPNTGVTATIVAHLPASPGVPAYDLPIVSSGQLDPDGFLSGQFDLPDDAPNGDYVVTLTCNGPNGGAVGGEGTSLTVRRPVLPVEPGPRAVVPSVPPPTVVEVPPAAPSAPPAAAMPGRARLAG